MDLRFNTLKKQRIDILRGNLNWEKPWGGERIHYVSGDYNELRQVYISSPLSSCGFVGV